MRPSHRIALLTLAILLPAGCGPGGGSRSQPSYADLAVLYNAELETLERLERKRAELIAEYERQHQPSADQAVQALSDMLNAAGQAGGGEAADGEPGDPHDALDRAVESAEKAHQASTQFLETALQARRTADHETDHAYPEELQRKLAALDEEIEKQKARVERARQARDAAEPK